MEMSDLESEPVVMQQPQSAEGLYEQMTATAIDMRSTQASDDWHEELWDLVQMVRKILNPPSHTRPGTLTDLVAEMFENAMRAGARLKSEHEMERERRHLRKTIDRLHLRLRRVRQNIWLGGALREVERDSYLAGRQECSDILRRWLEALERRMPEPEEFEAVARAYVKDLGFWQTLERPSTADERQAALDNLTRFHYCMKRTKRCYELRDRAIFLWEQPPPEPGPEEMDEIRESILQQLRSLSDSAPKA